MGVAATGRQAAGGAADVVPDMSLATQNESRPLRIHKAEIADLREGAIAGRRVRLPSGQSIPMGSPLSRDQIKDLAGGGVTEIEVLWGPRSDRTP